MTDTARKIYVTGLRNAHAMEAQAIELLQRQIGRLENYPEMAFRTEEVEARLLRLEHGLAFLDLRFVAEENAGVISIDCEYNEELFDGNTIEHLLRGYVAVLDQLTANPQVLVAQISVPAPLLEQATTARKREQRQTVAITSTFTAEPVEAPLAFWMKQLGIRANVSFAPYNQVFQQLLDPSSLISRNSDGFNVVLLRLTDWLRFEENSAPADAREKIERNLHELVSALQSSAQSTRSPILVCVCPAEQTFAAEPEWSHFLEELESTLVSETSRTAGIHVIPSARIARLYPVEDFEDEYQEDEEK